MESLSTARMLAVGDWGKQVSGGFGGGTRLGSVVTDRSTSGGFGGGGDGALCTLTSSFNKA
jgi:hypothetical protein